ncbi:DinB family protein [Brevibacillus choshinensis]|uniref:DinB family protein n=1 Tax=Brevibacillus choshinensis TaxID=54911 RepID=A0ABX7FR62_BRECH|nr:DinB family protein [Brevibacillus choshinensis]QRG68295.1 DinB family protein [Brevibacillus choshinensis]
MYRTIEEFMRNWNHEANSTQKVMDVLTDASLNQEVVQGHRTLGELAWHIITSLHDMMSKTGLIFDAVGSHGSQVPASAKEFGNSFRQSSESMIAAIKQQWTDESLKEINVIHGENWPNGLTLFILNCHLIHHRGQMTVLMRQAGLKVPGVYGPSQEEWAEYGLLKQTD